MLLYKQNFKLLSSFIKFLINMFIKKSHTVCELEQIHFHSNWILKILKALKFKNDLTRSIKQFFNHFDQTECVERIFIKQQTFYLQIPLSPVLTWVEIWRVYCQPEWDPVLLGKLLEAIVELLVQPPHTLKIWHVCLQLIGDLKVW